MIPDTLTISFALTDPAHISRAMKAQRPGKTVSDAARLAFVESFFHGPGLTADDYRECGKVAARKLKD